jgi:hypothetical protein
MKIEIKSKQVIFHPNASKKKNIYSEMAQIDLTGIQNKMIRENQCYQYCKLPVLLPGELSIRENT